MSTVQLQTIHVSICRQVFAYTQLNELTALFPTIQFSVSEKLNSCKYCYVPLTNQFNSGHLFPQG